MALADHPGEPHDPEQRINRQLHDLVVPQLFVVSSGLAALRRRVSGEQTEALVETLADSVEKALSDLRAISRGQPVGHLDDFERLLGRLELAATAAGKLTGCDVRFRAVGTLTPVSELEDDLTAFTRECTVNAIRHGQASAVDIDVRIADGALSVIVTDDGRWAIPAGDASTGLDGLRARAARWQGRVVVDHGGDATRVLWRIPLDTEGRPLT